MTDPKPRARTDPETLRARYVAQRSQVETILKQLFLDGALATDLLLAAVDETGPEHAFAQFSERPAALGKLADFRDEQWRSAVEEMPGLIHELVQTHEDLDICTLGDEELARTGDSGRLPVVNFQGRAFFIDDARKELRAVDDDNDRHPLRLEVVEPRELSVTERLALRNRVEPVQPDNSTPTRSRIR